jgi:SAM-dependent methyltransferase
MTHPALSPKSLLQTIWDFVGIPFRFVLFDQKWLPRFGWTTLEDERLNIVLPYVHDELLDIGSGENQLVRRYGRGIGVDIFDWGHGTVVVENTSNLPYHDASFDTITLVACLNHIPYREAVLKEARRLIKPDGTLIITMINPILGGIGHKIWWHGEDRQRGGMKEGEMEGMWTEDIVNVCNDAQFQLVQHRRFVYGLNNLYIFEPTL